ncbi:nucleoside-diphosphate kinase [bacterium]|nr:nucleoside-diphosphate kinase [bacterium]NBW98681.1 nucleoside-diphosphate kinase [bacterium]NBX81830.1 nucleoside-diphosphate kinase [bacterium]
MERTLGIIKPNSVSKNHIGRILTMGEEAGLKLVNMQMKTLSQAEAGGFYAEHKERPFFQSLVKFMTSGPVLLVVWEGNGAVEKWRQVMGATDPAKAAPGTIRKLFADSIEANSVHGSDSVTSAQRETAFFFA